MAVIGFFPVVKEILDQAISDEQRLRLFETLNFGVNTLVERYFKNPKIYSLQNDRSSVSAIEHHILVMNPGDKADVIKPIAAHEKIILFVKIQHGAYRLCDKKVNTGSSVRGPTS